MGIGHQAYATTGVPRPVGSTFRQRTLWAPHRASKHNVHWVVSVVNTPFGLVFEAKFHNDPQAIYASGVQYMSFAADVIKMAWEKRDEDGWRTFTVEECPTDGCVNPMPMWAHDSPRREQECLACATRTVLACVECGAPDLAHTRDRERLLADSLCFTCRVWTDRVTDRPEVIAADGRAYSFGSGRGPKEFKGFGGHEWVVTFTDGRVVETDDLWDAGEVPAWFRDRLPVNATVESKHKAEADR